MKKKRSSQEPKKDPQEGVEWNMQESCFEIGTNVTEDVAEAVAILMRKFDTNHPIWETELKRVPLNELTPEKSLFWLTGGTKEWQNLEHYNRPWCDAYLEFQEEFGMKIIKIVEGSKKLKDIRSGFIEHLNIEVLYEFALCRNMIK